MHPDIFESAILSFWTQKFPQICQSTCSVKSHPTVFMVSRCHIGLLFGKRLKTILLRHQIQKYPDSPSTRYQIRCGFIFFPLLKADSKISGFAAEFAGCV